MSVGGMLVTALMLGIVSETISDKIEDLKKGTSDVLEDNHRCGPSHASPVLQLRWGSTLGRVHGQSLVFVRVRTAHKLHTKPRTIGMNGRQVDAVRVCP